MISIDTILATLKSNAVSVLPGLISAASLTAIDLIERNINRDEDKCGLYIYPENIDLSATNDLLSVIYHLHLPNYDYSLSKDKYLDVIKDYIYSIDPHLIGFDIVDHLNCDPWPIDKNGVCIIYFIVYWQKFKDSCDE